MESPQAWIWDRYSERDPAYIRRVPNGRPVPRCGRIVYPSLDPRFKPFQCEREATHQRWCFEHWLGTVAIA